MKLDGKRVLIFTGGGETQVLNATIYGIVKKARENNMQILGGFQGWASLIEGGKIFDLTNIDIEGIENYGGTILKTSRTNPFNIENGVSQIKKTIKNYDINFIIAIGGDDTLSAAKRLYFDEKINIVGVPKTADNDLGKTYFSPGYPSAAFNLIKLCNEVRRDSAIPRHRLFLIESQGGHAGWLPMSAVLGKSDLITIPEFEVKLNDFLLKVKEIYNKNGKYGVICLSQETKFDIELGSYDIQEDGYGVKRKQHMIIDIKKIIEEKLKIPCQTIIPANSIRNGKGTKKDIEYSKKLGAKAIELLEQEKFGFMSTLIKKRNEIIVSEINLSEVVGKHNYNNVTKEFYDVNNFYPTKLFFEYITDITDKLHDDSKYYKLIENLHK